MSQAAETAMRTRGKTGDPARPRSRRLSTGARGEIELVRPPESQSWMELCKCVRGSPPANRSPYIILSFTTTAPKYTHHSTGHPSSYYTQHEYIFYNGIYHYFLAHRCWTGIPSWSRCLFFFTTGTGVYFFGALGPLRCTRININTRTKALQFFHLYAHSHCDPYIGCFDFTMNRQRMIHWALLASVARTSDAMLYELVPLQYRLVLMRMEIWSQQSCVLWGVIKCDKSIIFWYSQSVSGWIVSLCAHLGRDRGTRRLELFKLVWVVYFPGYFNSNTGPHNLWIIFDTTLMGAS